MTVSDKFDHDRHSHLCAVRITLLGEYCTGTIPCFPGNFTTVTANWTQSDMLFLLLSACLGRRCRHKRGVNGDMPSLRDFMQKDSSLFMDDARQARRREKKMERYILSKIEAALPDDEPIRVPRRHNSYWRASHSGRSTPRSVRRFLGGNTRQGSRYSYESYPAILIKPEQIYFPGVTDVIGPIASSRHIYTCPGQAPLPRERVMRLGSAVGLFPQKYQADSDGTR